MKYPLLLDALVSKPWAIKASTLEMMVRTLHNHEHGIQAATPYQRPRMSIPGMDAYAPVAEGEERIRFARVALSDAQLRPAAEAEPCVGVIPVWGVISKYLDYWSRGCGGVDLRDTQEDLLELARDPQVSEIVMHIHSPGGGIVGVAELGRLIAEINKSKPVYSWTDSDMCSAAYWLGCAGSEVFASPTASVGSIGVYMAWVDQARWMESNGLDLKIFKAGKHKAATLPGQMSEETAALFQAEIDSLAADFYGHVRTCRAALGVSVADDTMEGQCFLGRDAMKVGLVDGMYDQLEDLLTDLLTN